LVLTFTSARRALRSSVHPGNSWFPPLAARCFDSRCGFDLDDAGRNRSGEWRRGVLSFDSDGRSLIVCVRIDLECGDSSPLCGGVALAAVGGLCREDPAINHLAESGD